jgi:hypothetical protein
MGLLPPRLGWPSYLLLIYWSLNIRTIHLHPVGLVKTWHQIESIHSITSFSSVALRYDIFSRDPFMSQARDGMTTGNASQVPPPVVIVLVIDVNCVLVISILHFKNTSASRRNMISVGPL